MATGTSLEDSLRAIRDALGLRVNEDLIVWAARLETGRQRSGRPGVTLDALQDTWRRMHITVLPQENADLMRILQEYRATAAVPRATGSPAPAGPALPPAGAGPGAPTRNGRPAPAGDTPAAPAGPPAWYVPPVVDTAVDGAPVPNHRAPAGPPPAAGHPAVAPDHSADVTQQVSAKLVDSLGASATSAPSAPPEPAQPIRDARFVKTPAPAAGLEQPAGPLPEPGMFVGQADVMNPRDGYIGLTVTADRVDLMWEAAPPRAGLVLYLVAGSRDRIPNTAAEADRLAVTADTHISVPVGNRYYAVFAYQGGSPIAAAHDARAVRQAVGQVVPSPLQVEFVVNPDSVVLEWQQPPDVSGMQLRRSRPDEPLPRFADASLVKQLLPGQSNFLDLEVEPGRTYVYELVCLADAPRPEGGTDQSPPWSSGPVVIPALPERVDALDGTIVDAGGQVRCRLSWPTVSRGKVSIYAKPGGPGVLGELAPDRILTSEELTRLPLGTRVVWGMTVQDGHDVLDGFAVDATVSPEWCYTPVTEMAGKYILGRSQVLTHVGAIGEVDFTDRIFWQFLRFEWPTGAAEVVAEIDGATYRTSKEKYELYGGVRLMLSAHPTVVTIWGTRTYRGVALVGRHAEVHYPGRRIVFYQFDYSRFGNGRRLRVRPEVPMPQLELAVIGGTELYPLTAEQSVQPGFGVVQPFSVPAGSITPADWTTFEFKQPDPVRYMRLFVKSAESEPIAAVEWPPPVPPITRRAQRCPNCLAPPNPSSQFFRCSQEGTCVAVEDALLTRVRGVTTTAKPWSVHTLERGVAVGQIHCTHCGKPTREEFCAGCGETFPTSDWWQTDCFAVTMLGPRHSGKTSMLQAQSYALLDGLAETWGGHAGALDPYSRALMKRYHDEWESGQLQQGTLAARQNRDVLRPIQFGVAFPQYPRPAALSLFDVAGEDMEDPDQVAHYSNSLFNGDALVYLVDPLQITEVRTALAGFVTLPPEGGATPVQGLQNVITVLRRKYGMGVKLPIRLAVVFSKFDAIQQATLVPGSPIAGTLPFGSALLRDPYSNPGAHTLVFDAVDGIAVHNEARTLLSLLGGSSILNLVEGNFSNFHYFVTSSTGHTPASNTMHSTAKAPHRLFDPLRWTIQS